MLFLVPPRHFCDLSVPEGVIDPDDRYNSYVRWISDYLHKVEIPLSENQKAWLDSRAWTPQEVILQCSDGYGYALLELDLLASFLAEGGTWQKYREDCYAVWQESGQGEGFTFEECSPLTETGFERLRKEWLQEAKLTEPVRHNDMPFRSLLAWALRQMPDAGERFNQMDFYFRNLNDNASK